jgi:uncharacterized protein
LAGRWLAPGGRIAIIGDTMRTASALLLLAGLLTAPVTPVAGAGFDCKRAVKAAEHAICENDDLSTLDGQQTILYSMLLETVHPELKPNLRDSQRRFLTRRNGCQANVPCLQSEYLWRFHELCGVAQLYGRSCADHLEQPR